MIQVIFLQKKQKKKSFFNLKELQKQDDDIKAMHLNAIVIF